MATYKVKANGEEHSVKVVDNPGGGATVTVDDEHTFQVEFTGGGAEVPAAMAGLPEVHAARAPAAPAAPARAPSGAGPAAAPSNAGPGAVTAPIPGKIISIKVAVGDRVEVNQLLLKLEAMKMENNVVAPISGAVTRIDIGEGSEVAAGQLLVTIEP